MADTRSSPCDGLEIPQRRASDIKPRMTPRDIAHIIAAIDEDALFAEGFQDALIGYVQIFNKIVALYDREKCICLLMRRDGMTFEDAEEYFCFNVTGSYVGDSTPAFATIMR